jgi:hypothetical protein
MQTANYKNVPQLLLWIVLNHNNHPHRALITAQMVVKVALIVPKRRKLGLFYTFSFNFF